MRNKRWRILQERRRLRNLERKTSPNSYFHGAYYDEEQKRYIRFFYEGTKIVRKRYNRRIRRKINNGIDISNGREFRKLVWRYTWEFI